MDYTGTITRTEQYRHGWHLYLVPDAYFFVPLADLRLALHIGDTVSLRANPWRIAYHLEKNNQVLYHYPTILEWTGTPLRSFLLAANLSAKELARKLSYTYLHMARIVDADEPISARFLARFATSFQEVYPQWFSILLSGISIPNPSITALTSTANSPNRK